MLLRKFAFCVLFSGIPLLPVLAGCQWVPKSSYSTIETQNRTLLEQNQAQLAEIENLKAHSRTIEDRLLMAEEELRTQSGRSEIDRARLENLQKEREALRRTWQNTPVPK